MEPQRIEPGPGQESVWDYPRPPRLEPVTSELRVELNGETIARTTRGHRVLETSQPPAYYFPPEDVRADALRPSTHGTFCEWKGNATEPIGLALRTRSAGGSVAGASPRRGRDPKARAVTRDKTARAERSIAVQAMEGAFYGGWITSRIVGPFKGGPGTAHW
jgi:hypothetical protein